MSADTITHRHRCAVHPCPELCEDGHVTCAAAHHRVREPALLAAYRGHDARHREQIERTRAEQQAQLERIRNDPETRRRTEQILTDIRTHRAVAQNARGKTP